MDKKEKLKAFLKSRNAVAGYVLAGWLSLWGLIFVVGNILESLLLFILLYNLVYPVATVFCCYAFSKKNGIVWFMPVAMAVISVVLYVATELVKFALPNAIVMTIVTVFFGTGFGNIMHGNNEKKRK